MAGYTNEFPFPKVTDDHATWLTCSHRLPAIGACDAGQQETSFQDGPRLNSGSTGVTPENPDWKWPGLEIGSVGKTLKVGVVVNAGWSHPWVGSNGLCNHLPHAHAT